MDPVKEQAVNALKAQLDEVATYEAASLSEGKDLGAIDFRNGQSLFEQSIELANEFRSLPLDLLPLATIQGLQSPVQQLAAGLKQVASFTLVGQQNPENQRNAILQNARTYHDQAFTAMTPHLAYLSLKSAQVQETMRRSAELLRDTQQKVQETLQELDRKKTDLDSIVRSAREAAAKIGVAQFATKFEEIAKQHDDASRSWLKATGALGVITVVVAIGFLYVLPPPRRDQRSRHYSEDRYETCGDIHLLLRGHLGGAELPSAPAPLGRERSSAERAIDL